MLQSSLAAGFPEELEITDRLDLLTSCIHSSAFHPVAPLKPVLLREFHSDHAGFPVVSSHLILCAPPLVILSTPGSPKSEPSSPRSPASDLDTQIPANSLNPSVHVPIIVHSHSSHSAPKSNTCGAVTMQQVL